MAKLPVFSIKILSQSGVITIPIKPEMLALNMAVGRLPLAMATITTDEETVEGNTAKKKMANHRSDAIPSLKNGINKRVSRGNNTNVVN